ncbi:MAG: hypothetical protein ACXVA9_09320 [Bdellovibrionales bacterium]
MIKILFSVLLGSVAFSIAHAEDTTCAVKGMHCEACQEMVQGKVCEEGKYSQCDVKIIDAKKELGEIHLVTKDEKAKVDQKVVGAAVKDAGYTLQKCKASAAKPDAKKAKG